MSKNFVVLKKMTSFAASNKEILHFSIQILFIKFKVPLVRAGLFHFYSHFALITRKKIYFCIVVGTILAILINE